ncbi:MAG: AAA family ATPase, partial [Eggerthella lenta]
MKPFILLLKIQLLGLFGINKTLHADPAKAKRTLALAALVVAAVVLFASAYSAGVAQGLVQIGLAEAVPLVAVLVGAIAGAVAAFLKTNGVLFGFKDYDLVMSLPVPTSSVVLSRIASLYAMSLLFGVLVMVRALAQGLPDPKASVAEAMEAVGLREAARDRAKDYSLGMKQRLGLALALIGRPDVLLLDEPFNGLDPEGVRLVRRLLENLATQRECAVLVSSHVLDQLER